MYYPKPFTPRLLALGLLATLNVAPVAEAATACGSAATRISAVQGSASASPLAGQSGISIEGIVIGTYQGSSGNSLRGFFVQEEDADADGNPATSEGLFVFDGGNPLYAGIAVGDRVRVTGMVNEFFGMTEITSVNELQTCATGQALPTAATLTLPVPGVPGGDLAAATAAINAYYEAYEGMLVNFPATLSVAEYFQLERYGQLILSQGGRLPIFTATSAPSVPGFIEHQIEVARRKVILDDKDNAQNSALINAAPLPYPQPGLGTEHRFRGGDTITQLTGVLHWSFAGAGGTDAWRIRPVTERYDYRFTPANPRPATAPSVAGTLTVASYNLLNYFTTIDTTASDSAGPCAPDATQDCRGADSVNELQRQTAKAVSALCGMNADIVGLMEIENNAAASLAALATAANGINQCGPYTYLDTGAIGSDAIKVGLLYKTSRVVPVGSHALLTTAVDSRFSDDKNRLSLAQTFRELASSEEFTVAVNHLKSKSADCNDLGDPDQHDGQGNCNLTREKAAHALVDWLARDPTRSGDADFLIIGDLNSYALEDPVRAILKGADDIAGTSDDYNDLLQTFGGATAYSYVFDGQTGYLDHALASHSLLPQVTGATHWHINADEPPAFDYNDTVQDAGEASFEAKPAALPLYEANPFRSSDHDPLVIGLDLSTPLNTITGTAKADRLKGTAGDDRLIGLEKADRLSGGPGYDQFVYTGLKDRRDIITDFTVGEDKIVLAGLLQSLAISSTDPLAEGYLRCKAKRRHSVLKVDRDADGPARKRALILVKNIRCSRLMQAANFLF